MTEMKLEEKEVEALLALQKEVHGLVQAVGQNEVRKQRLLLEIAAKEDTAQSIMAEAARRLGIDEGVPWQMAPDGTVHVREKPRTP